MAERGRRIKGGCAECYCQICDGIGYQISGLSPWRRHFSARKGGAFHAQDAGRIRAFMHYPIATAGTLVVLAAAFLILKTTNAVLARSKLDEQERYRKRERIRLVVVVLSIAVVAALWIRLLQQKGTFLGLLGAGLAVALREPLLSIAGRISIFITRTFQVGDRIEIGGMAGDVVHVGVFYTRMFEIGKWIAGDQATGRIVQFSNAQIYQNPVFNYTGGFPYLWDEVLLPVTYDSNRERARQIMLEAGDTVTASFQQEAERQVKLLADRYLLPNFQLKPVVYLKVTSNYLELRMRYLVGAKERRTVNSAIYERMFAKVAEAEDVRMGSETMDLTLHGRSEAAAGEGAQEEGQEAGRA